jgi:hypothetical protein
MSFGGVIWGSGLRYCSYWGVGYWVLGIGLTGVGSGPATHLYFIKQFWMIIQEFKQIGN